MVSLQEKYPDIAAEWSTKNYPLTPDMISYGSNQVVWWIGKCGHEWNTSVKARSHGERCPICSGARVLPGFNDLASQYPNLALEWSKKNIDLTPSMVTAGSHKTILWTCKYGHEWPATIKNRTLNKTGCPYCSHNKILPGFNDLASVFPNLALEWSDKNFPLSPTQVTAFSNHKVWWKCKEGHEWNTLISTRAYGSPCPYCSGIKILRGYNDLATRYPLLAADWSIKNAELLLPLTSEKSTKNVWWKCHVCGFEWKSVIRSRVAGSGCPVCTNKTIQAGYNDIATTDIESLLEWDYEKNEVKPTQVSRNSLRYVFWKCKFGHSWRAKISEKIIDKKSCPYCEQGFHEAFLKMIIAYYAEKKGIDYILNSPEIIGIDLETYLPEYAIAVEVKATSQKKQKEQLVKAYICHKNGIQYHLLPKTATTNFIAKKVKQIFFSLNLFIESDIEEDIRYCRDVFFSK